MALPLKVSCPNKRFGKGSKFLGLISAFSRRGESLFGVFKSLFLETPVENLLGFPENIFGGSLQDSLEFF